MPIFVVCSQRFDITKEQLAKDPASLLAEAAALDSEKEIVLDRWPHPHTGVFEGVLGCLTGVRPVPADDVKVAHMHAALLYFNIQTYLWPKGVSLYHAAQQQKAKDMKRAQELLKMIVTEMSMNPQPLANEGDNPYTVKYCFYLSTRGSTMDIYGRPQKAAWLEGLTPLVFEHQALAQRCAAAECLRLEFDTSRDNSCLVTVTVRE